MPTARASGRCLCGAVSFSIELPTKWVAHCHCENCQRAHGAAFVTWVSVEEAHVTTNAPAGVLRWFASTAEAQRGFCSRCGSSLFFRSVQWPGELHIARANFLDPIDREPAMHGFFDAHVTWFQVNDDLPKKSAPVS